MILVLAATVVSCKKENTGMNAGTVNQPPAGTRIKTKSYGATLQTFDYNANGLIAKRTTAGKAFPDYTCDYNGSTIIMKRYQADGTLSENITMILNDKGLVEDYTNSLSPSTTFKYEYDQTSRMIKMTQYTNGSVSSHTTYQYTNGNLVSDSTFSNGSSLNYTRHYEYYSNILSTVGNENFGEVYWGKGSNNAVKKITFKDGAGAITGTQDYQLPELDNKSRIRKVIYQSSNAPAQTIVEYTYY